MKAAIVALTVLVAALAQVVVAPLFPIAGAIPEIVVLAIIAIAFGAGPRSAMVATPALAIIVAFTSDRAPALVLLAYLPVLPLAALAEAAPLPAGRYLRFLVTAVAAGLWARLTFSGGAFLDGAPFEPVVLVRSVLLPGVIFDAALLSLLYLPGRFTGWTVRSLSLQRTGWL